MNTPKALSRKLVAWRLTCLFTLLVLGHSAQLASAAGKNAIEDIAIANLPGSRVQLTFRMSQRPTKPHSFSITNPARVALDFSDTGLKIDKTDIRVGQGALVSIKALESDQRTRVILNLVKSVGYQTDIVGNNLIIVLDSPVSTIAGAAEEQPRRFSSKEKRGRFNVENLDFRRGPHGDAKVIVTLSDPSIGIDIKEQGGNIILDLIDTAVPKKLERRLDVVDFATPVQTIDVYGLNNNTRIVVSPIGKFQHLAYQTGNIFTLNVKPISEEKAAELEKDEFGYSGEKLSLNFQNIEARAALQVLADFTGLNFVVSDSVKGNVTLRLKDVPWDQALDLILDAKGLAMRRKGNVVTVAPADEVAAKEKAALEAVQTVLELEPLSTELIQINYAKAEDIAALLKSIKAVTTGGADHPVFNTPVAVNKESTDSNTLLSPRGQVTVDARTNSVLIQDTAAKLREVRKLIAKLDQPVRQVMIETRLVEASSNFSKSLGSKFGYSDSYAAANGDVVRVGSNLDPASNALVNGLNVNLPTAGAGASAPAGTIGATITKLSGAILNLELSALEQEGSGKIISSPRLVTANQQQATIEQGQERVFTTSVLGVGTVVTKKATLKLDVTPQITPDDRVILDVNITKDNFVNALEGLLNVKEIKTQVLLDNGETVVIGGIYELDQNTTRNKVPFFGDLPLLGWLFKNKASNEIKTELLIFLTPRILSEFNSIR